MARSPGDGTELCSHFRELELELYDAREESPTSGEIQEICMERITTFFKVPPHVVNGFKAIGTEKAIVANCASIAHDPEEIERLDLLISPSGMTGVSVMDKMPLTILSPVQRVLSAIIFIRFLRPRTGKDTGDQQKPRAFSWTIGSI